MAMNTSMLPFQDTPLDLPQVSKWSMDILTLILKCFFADRCQEARGGDVESKERGRQFCHASSPRQQGLQTKRSFIY